LLVFSPSQAQSVNFGTVVVNTSFLNVRNGPGSQFLVIGVVRGGAELPVTGITSDRAWWRVQTPAGEGFVFAEFVLYRGEGSVVPFVGAGGSASPEPPTAIVLSQSLNVRSGPNQNFPSLGSVPQAFVLSITGQNPQTGWYQVTSPFGTGWIANNEVALAGDTSIIPKVDASGAITSGTAISSTTTGTGTTATGGTSSITPGITPALGADATLLDRELLTFGFQPTNYRAGATVNFDALFIRARPYYGSPIIGAAARGDAITVMGRDDDAIFLLIEAPAATGWAPVLGVNLASDVFTIPIANANPQLSIEGKPSVPSGSDISTGGGPAGFTTKANVIVHIRPQPEAAAIGSLGAGVKATVIGRDFDIAFYQIQTPFGVGWVRANHDLGLPTNSDPFNIPVTAVNGIPVGGQPTTVTTTTGTTAGTTAGVVSSGASTSTSLAGPVVVVNTSSLNLRSGPGGQFAVISVVVGGQQFRVTGQLRDASWYRVDTPFGEGWLFSQYVAFRGDGSSVPIVSS
jgi:uncharacterized protein YgiM (DUF1202 family)